jgi:hypothetical protein
MNTNQTARAISLAQKHAKCSSSIFCLVDAVRQQERGNEEAAIMWARKSLAYSVGVFHPDFRAIEEGMGAYDHISTRMLEGAVRHGVQLEACGPYRPQQILDYRASR